MMDCNLCGHPDVPLVEMHSLRINCPSMFDTINKDGSPYLYYLPSGERFGDNKELLVCERCIHELRKVILKKPSKTNKELNREEILSKVL